MDADNIKKKPITFRATEAFLLPLEEIVANRYNPNRMPDSLMSMLCTCIEKFSFVFPILVTWDKELQKYRIIDGYHRYEALKRLGAKEAAVVDMKLPYHEAVQLTVLMNRIKGHHQVSLMSDLVMKLEDLGLQDSEICENLGMETEEYLRLKQQLGIAHAFKNHEYSKSWDVDEKGV